MYTYYIYVRVYESVRVHNYIYMCIYMYIPTEVNTHMQTHTQSNTHAHRCAQVTRLIFTRHNEFICDILNVSHECHTVDMSHVNLFTCDKNILHVTLSFICVMTHRNWRHSSKVDASAHVMVQHQVLLQRLPTNHM